METVQTQPRKVMTRWQAAGLHLLISVVVAAVVLFFLIRVWYPQPLFTAEGGSELLTVLVLVDVVLGPLITLIIFKVSKPELRRDLLCIALLQVCAMAYGVYVMFVARPVYVALVDDQFETVRANDLSNAALREARLAEFRSLPLTGPRYVAVDLPRDQKELADIISNSVKTGSVVTHQPKYYVPYTQYREQVAKKGAPLDEAIKRGGDFAALASNYLQSSGRVATDLKYLPMQTRRGWGAVLLDVKSGDIVAMIPPKI